MKRKSYAERIRQSKRDKGKRNAAWRAARADLLEDMELNKMADAAKTQKRITVNLEV